MTASPRAPHRAIVVGAGPAGSVAAALLARRGFDVTFLESARFPRDKVCGECVSALGANLLREHGLAADLEAYRPVELSRGRILAASGAGVDLPLPEPFWGLRRDLMDHTLRNAATAAGARLLCPARALRIMPGDPPSVEVRLADGETISLAGDVVLLADGKSLLPDRPGHPRRPPLTGDLGVKAHFADAEFDPACIGLFSLHGHYAGLAAVRGRDGICWNLAMSVPARRVRDHAGDLDRLFQTLMAENDGLASALGNASRLGMWLSCPLPRYAVRESWPAGVIPIGNAAAALEPIGGEGMGLAIASAALVAARVCEGPWTEQRAQALRGAFQRLWQVRRTACRAAALALSRPGFAQTGVRLMRAVPGLGGAATRLVGKRRRGFAAGETRS